MLREILWLMLNDIDLEGSRATGVMARSPTIELKTPEDGSHLELIKKQQRPRMFMTHTPFVFLGRQILAKLPKVIIMMRNPKDVQVSVCHIQYS
jgi:hypothetical protein